MAIDKQSRVLVTGGGTFLGIHIASALLAEGAEVTLLIREGNENRLGILETQVRWHVADVWDAASLKGRARGHGTVIHTVGSMVDDPAQGLTFQRLNVVSARNAANMCVSDGVNHFVLMSAPRAPWINRQYVNAKREAESYVRRVGLKTSIIRAPLTYMRGTRRPIFYQMMSVIGSVPPLSWTPLGRIAPIPLDILARGVARTALKPPQQTQVLFSRQIRRLTTREDRQQTRRDVVTGFDVPEEKQETLPFELLDEETPFGWIPPTNSRED